MKIPLQVRYRLWFECEGEHVLGGGMIRLLREVRDQGSLKKAAEQLNMPYRGAWGRIRRAEESMGASLLESSRYRQKGVTLTPLALSLLNLFATLDSRCAAFLRDSLKNSEDDFFEIGQEPHC
ncbi:MAG: LysR family transcriptional regulator [Desulfovibrio sp.]|nr:LysR family transcriptional regulator [Desulfovibrio sp.]